MNFIPVIFLACGIIMFIVAFQEPFEGRQSPVPQEILSDTETTPLLSQQRLLNEQEVRQRTNENNDSNKTSYTPISDEPGWDMV